MNAKKNNLAAAAFCVLAAGLALLFCSTNSWLYPLNSWVDANIHFTVGRGMLEGKIPYRDLIDQKGPLLYAINALGAWLVPGTYHGLYVLEVAAMAAYLYFALRTARLYAPQLSAAWMALPALATTTSLAFQQGASAEEFLLPVLMWTVFDLMRALRGERLAPTEVLRNGVLAGCVLWVKFNLLAICFVWVAAQLISGWARGEKVSKLAKLCALYLAGMALASAPWIAYFGANGALGDLWRRYFCDNLFSYGGAQVSPLRSLALALYYGVTLNPGFSAMLALAAGAVLLAPRARLSAGEKLCVAALAVLAALAMYLRMALNLYYYLVFAVFLPFALIPLARLRAPKHRTLAAACALLACGLGAWRFGQCTEHIGTPLSETPQGQAAQIIRAAGDDATLLSYHTMDGGFYMISGAEPQEAWFTRMNMNREECYAAQDACAARGGAAFLICEGDVEPPEGYEIAAEYVSDYGAAKADGARKFTLYRRAETEDIAE